MPPPPPVSARGGSAKAMCIPPGYHAPARPSPGRRRCLLNCPCPNHGRCGFTVTPWIVFVRQGRHRPFAHLAANKLVSISPATPRGGGDKGIGVMMITLPPDYRPSESEEFMNPIQTEYFRQKLLRWRAELLREADGTLASLSSAGGIHEADITDRASVETDRALELRTRDRARKLINKIDQACCGSTPAPTGSARKPPSRSASSGSKPARSPPCRSRRRSGTSAWSASTATTERTPIASR